MDRLRRTTICQRRLRHTHLAAQQQQRLQPQGWLALVVDCRPLQRRSPGTCRSRVPDSGGGHPCHFIAITGRDGDPANRKPDQNRAAAKCRLPILWPVSAPTAASLNRRDLSIRGGRPHTSPYIGNILFRRWQPCGLARIVASGQLASECAMRTYISVYRAMAKLYRP